MPQPVNGDRRQFVGVSSLLPFPGLKGWSSGRQSWRQASLPMEVYETCLDFAFPAFKKNFSLIVSANLSQEQEEAKLEPSRRENLS